MKFSIQINIIILLLSLLSTSAFSQKSEISITNEDEKIINDIINKYSEDKNLSTGELVIKIGQFFLETPYIAHTLEENLNEHLVVNLREMDCTTFAEYCLALARIIKQKDPKVSNFNKELCKIRYRNGVIENYPSRLHYFSDWIYDNDKKKIIKNITIGEPFKLKVNFMSEHPKSYLALKLNPGFIEQIKQQEKAISTRDFRYIPKAKLHLSEKKIKNGDIIGITTSINGMDIMHVVIAIWQKGKLHILHASQSHEKVLISEETLEEYLANRNKATGIMVARPR